MDKWEIIQDFPKYAIDQYGNIKSCHFGKEHFFKPEIDKDGYERVVLCNNGRHCRKLVHRLVAEHFKEKTPGYELMTIDHLNGNKRDNRPENLEWVSSSENLRRAHKNGNYKSIHSRQSIPIFVTDLWSGEEKYYDNMAIAAAELGVTKASISAALNRNSNLVQHYLIERAGREERLLYGTHFEEYY